MRSLTPALRTKLDVRVTTWCNCWRLARKDGAVLGFTDHDRDIVFNGVTFRANTGLTATQMESGVGFAPGTGEATGALQSDSLTENDLLNGAYDGASVEIWLVDWSAPDDRVLLDIAAIGEVRRSEFAFAAELRSAAHLFDQQRGQSYQRSCNADLGDARCGVDLARPGFKATGVVVSSAGGVTVADLSDAFDLNFFTGGVLRFSSGANAGARFTVKSHRQDALRASFALWSDPAQPVAAGDALEVSAGCDKSAMSCQMKFSNILAFRGFPHMPGNDRVIAYPSTLAPAMDGGSFFR